MSRTSGPDFRASGPGTAVNAAVSAETDGTYPRTERTGGFPSRTLTPSAETAVSVRRHGRAYDDVIMRFQKVSKK